MRTASLALAAVLAAPCRLLAATGGPDAGGYTWADSDEPGVDLGYPTFAATDLRAQGFSGDEAVIAIPLPPAVFPAGFPFYGRRYTTAWLSSNGWLAFADPLGRAVPATAPLPTPGAPDATIAFYWDDYTLESLIPQALAGPHLANDGFTILLRLARNGAPGYSSQIRIVLWVSGVIKVIWNEVPEQMLSGATRVGLEDEIATAGLTFLDRGVAQNGAAFRNGGFAVEFYPRGQLDCATAVTPLGCPQAPLAGSNAAGQDRVPAWTCAGGSWTGNEKVYELNVPRLADVTLTLVNGDGRDRALFLVDASCSEYSGCLAGGSTTLAPPTLSPGRYWLVVDGRTAADNGAFTIETACRAATTPIACGDRLQLQATSASDVLDGWPCAAPPLPGNERIYEASVAGPVTLRATLSNPSDPSLRVLLSEGAGFDVANPSCLAASASEAVAWGVSGSTLITVDGSGGPGATFDLAVDCERKLQCPGPRPLDVLNPAPVAGDTTGKPSSTDTYRCASSQLGTPGPVGGFTGPEEVWEFTLASPRAVYVHLSAANPDLRAFLLADCYEGSCISEGACGTELAPGTYRVVVDGANGAAGPYTLTPFALPPAPFTPWYECPECGGSCGQTPATTRARNWQFDSGNFCGTGCDFSLFAVVECGTEFHLPFWDVETGHVRVYDVYAERYVPLTTTNHDTSPGCAYQETGTLVGWEDRGCSAIPCPAANCGGGSDCRTNQHVIDVSFQGTPSVCGIYRVDFLNWGGFVWNAYANCSGDTTELYDLYRDLCSALSDYNPLPEIMITGVYVDNTTCGGSGDARGTVTIQNIGCLAASNVEIEIAPSAPPGPAPVTVTGSVDKGGSVTIPWSFPIPARPYSLDFRVDPANRTAECSEGLGGAVRCGSTTTGKRLWPASVCGSNCNTLARAGPRADVCAGQPYVLDGSASRFQCTPTAVQEYRWQDALGNALPGCDWSTNADCALDATQLPAGVHEFTLRTRCRGDLPCESQAYTQVAVSQSNVRPEARGNVLWLRRDAGDVVAWWPAYQGTPIQGFRLWKDGDRRVPTASRQQAAGTDALGQTARDAGAVAAPPAPVAYYQLVALSCLGDLESPY